jgi:hypothetical protein
MAAENSDIQGQIFRRMTPEQRLRAAERLYWSARELKAASLRTWHPELSEAEIHQRVKEAFMYARS